jgi:hypothetical protein
MTEAERIARAHRATAALDEFLTPMFDDLREEYRNRISEVATTELHPGTRADKITTLSVALRVVDTLKSGMAEIVRDGELARRDKLRADDIARMSDAQQRLLRIAG